MTKPSAPKRRAQDRSPGPQDKSRRAAAPLLPAGTIGRPVPTMPPPRETRVGKTLQPGQGGTIKLQRRFGDALLQVRYRYDWTGLYRYTTVELLVEVAPVMRSNRLDTLFTLHLSPSEATLQHEARRLGAQWNDELKCWIAPGHVIQALDLAHRAESTTQRHRLRDKRRPRRK